MGGSEVGVRSRSGAGWFRGSSGVPPGGDEFCRWWFTDRPDKETERFRASISGPTTLLLRVVSLPRGYQGSC